MLKAGLRAEIIAIVSGVVLVATGAIVATSGYIFVREYSQAMQSRSIAIGKSLSLELERRLQLGVAVENVAGFDERCRETVKGYPGLDYAMVVDRKGSVIFHSDPAMMGRRIGDPALLRAIDARRETVVRYPADGIDTYGAVLPLYGPKRTATASVVVGFPASAIASGARRIAAIGIAAGVAVLVLGVAILFVSLTIYVTRPLGALTGAVQQMRGAGAKPIARAEIRSRDEVGQLAAAFNDMAARVEGVIQTERAYAAAEAASREHAERLTELTSTVRRLEEAQDAGVNLLEDLDQRRRDLEVEIATREAAQARLRETLERRRYQFDIVGMVAQSDALAAGDVEGLARQITELAVQTAGYARANVWLFNDDDTELRCIDLYEAATGTHSSGLVLHADEFGAEFATLIKDRYVDADDASTDPRTAGYVAGYVKPLGITAMLDVLIGASGRHFGLLCFEHVGKPHHWEPDEIAFAGQLADKIAFALGVQARRQAEAQVRANEAALAEAQSIAHVGSWELDYATGRLTWSRETYRIFGVNPDGFDPSYAALLARVHPDDRAEFERAYRESIANRRPYNLEHRIVAGEGGVRWVHERGETFYGADGRPARSVGTVQDITDRRGTEDVLRQALAWYVGMRLLVIFDSRAEKEFGH